MYEKTVQEVKKYVSCSKTRSEPPDMNDPYKLDLLEAQLIAKYEKMLKQQSNKQEANGQAQSHFPKIQKQLPQKQRQDLVQLLKNLDADMDQSLLEEILRQATTNSKDI